MLKRHVRIVPALGVALVLLTGCGLGPTASGGSPSPRVTTVVITPTSASPAAPAQPSGQAGSPTPAAPSSASYAPPPQTPPIYGLAAAEAKVRSLGYTPNPDSASHWDNSASLHVIVGILTGSADGHPLWAFFFADGRYLGTDTAQPSALIELAWTKSDTVAITYDLYVPQDPMCCPSAGTATVRYQWNGSQLTALDPIPAASGPGPNRRVA